MNGIVVSFVLVAVSTFVIGFALGRVRPSSDTTGDREESPPQPTIASEAIDRESAMRRTLGDAARNRILAVTYTRNERGMPHVCPEEMDDLCFQMELAAGAIVERWMPSPSRSGVEPAAADR